MGHEWERDEMERWFCFASEASACCVEEGLRVNLGRGDFFWRAKRASVALKKGCGPSSGTAVFAWRAKRASVALGSSHARPRRRTVPEWGPKSYAPVKPDNVQIRFWFFFLTKRRQKKTREQFNSEYEKKRLPRRGWVLLKWPILAIFVKKWPFKPAIS